MVTEKQLSNIYNLPKEDLRQILDVCIDALGMVDVQDGCNALGIGRARLYQLMNDQNTLKIGIHKFYLINYKQLT